MYSVRKRTKMRKLLLALATVAAVSTVNAQGHRHHNHHYHHHHHHNNSAHIALGILGAAVVTNAIVNSYRAPIVVTAPQTYTTMMATNCLMNVYNPYTNTYENVVVTCNQPMIQYIR